MTNRWHPTSWFRTCDKVDKFLGLPVSWKEQTLNSLYTENVRNVTWLMSKGMIFVNAPLVLYSRNLYTHFKICIKWEIKFTGVFDKYKYTYTLNTSPWELHPPHLSHSSASATVLVTAKYLQQQYIILINGLAGNHVSQFNNTIWSNILLHLPTILVNIILCLP
jgi:hypothetical protein